MKDSISYQTASLQVLAGDRGFVLLYTIGIKGFSFSGWPAVPLSGHLTTGDHTLYIFESSSPTDTLEFAKKIAEDLKPGDIITLDGDLGAGKTVFSKGIAKGLGVTDEVTSPTFIIMQTYSGGRLPLYHFDVYRLEDSDELAETGAEEYLFGDGVSVIEWAEIIEDILPDSIIRVIITRDPEKGDDYRKITIDNAEFLPG